MNIDDLVLVSIDDHVVEPPNMFDGRLAAKYVDDAPRVVKDDNGVDRWMYRGNQTGVVGLNAVVSWPKTEWGFDPAGFDEMRPGSYDIHARVRDMDVNGITASMCFPTFAGFSAGHFRHVKDETTNAVIRAYNDWHIEDWCGAYPDRFLPLSIVPSWDQAEADRRDQARRRQGRQGDHVARAPAPRRAAELSRHGSLGPDLRSADRQRAGDVPAHRSGLRRAAARPRRAGRQPDDHGLPDLDARRPGPAVGPGVPHVPGAEGRLLRGRHRVDPVLPRPLRPSLHQPGVAARRGPTSAASCRARCSASTPSPATSPTRRRSGCATRSASTSSPGSATTRTPTRSGRTPPRQMLGELNAVGATDEEIDKISWQNACRFFDWDPFQKGSRAEHTVGALRARSTDVDMSTTTARSTPSATRLPTPAPESRLRPRSVDRPAAHPPVRAVTSTDAVSWLPQILSPRFEAVTRPKVGRVSAANSDERGSTG